MSLHKTICLALLHALIIFSPSCKKTVGSGMVAPPVVTPPVTPAPTLNYQLVWSDEFNGTAIDMANWNFETGGSGWGNNEKEYYQAANATIEDSNLVITAKKETVGSNPYTSARMTTADKQTFTYGKIEARMKLPVGQGLWPAFWALGANIKTVNWPACGELDIMEHINADNLIYGTIHWDNNGHASISDKTTTTPQDYHVYGVEWEPTGITWYVDSVKYEQADIANGINNTAAFAKPFFLILNLAVGGNWPGQTVDESKLPAKLYIDYVRVYQKK